MNLEGFHSIERMARGGFATVYSAADATTGRPVVIKVLDRIDHADRDHFRRRVEQVKPLNSRAGVVGVIDMVETPDGDLALVQQYLPGGSVDDIIVDQADGIGESDAAWVSGRVLETLAVAHQAGIVHAQLKPSNILFGNGNVCLADFEMAALNESPTWGGGAVSANAVFAAPEILMGDDPAVAADLYSVGVLGYYLATGLRVNATVAEAMAWAARGTPPLSFDTSRLSAEFASWLSVVASHDPRQRFGSAMEAMAQLSRVIPPEPSPALRSLLEARIHTGDVPVAVPISNQGPDSQSNRSLPSQTGANPTIVMPAVSIGSNPGEAWDPPTSPTDQIHSRPPQRPDPMSDRDDGEGATAVIRRPSQEYPVTSAMPSHTGASMEHTAEMARVQAMTGHTYDGHDHGLPSGEAANDYDIDEPDRRLVLAFSAVALIVIAVIGIAIVKFGGNVAGGGGPTQDQSVASNGIDQVGSTEVVVPPVVGLTIEDASSQIRELGMFVQIDEEINDAVRDGYVVSQSVPGNSPGRAGLTITLVVSTGPAMVPFPNLAGYSEIEAMAEIESMGLTASVEYKDVEYGSPEDGHVVFQEPVAGVDVDDTSVIVLTVGQAPRACEIKTDVAAPAPVSLVPPLVRGDADFGANGPRMTLRIDLVAEAHQVSGTLELTGEETRRDFTTVAGTKTIVLYSAPEGWNIRTVGVEERFDHKYKDSDVAEDVFSFTDRLVTNLSYVGDVRGPEAGTLTGVMVSFNQFNVELVEAADCVVVEDLPDQDPEA